MAKMANLDTFCFLLAVASAFAGFVAAVLVTGALLPDFFVGSGALLPDFFVGSGALLPGFFAVSGVLLSDLLVGSVVNGVFLSVIFHSIIGVWYYRTND